jgi:hypothetical protein
LIANQVKGTGFRGTLDYLLGKDEAAIIGGNMLGENPKELSNEFSVSRALRPKLTRAVYHASLSLPHDEHLPTSKWKEAADKYVQKMGFEGSQYVVVKHNDTKHEHVHIVASRVRLDGSVVSDSQDYKRSEKVVRGLEKHFGLTPTLSSHEVEKKALTKGELHKVLRERKPSIKMQLQQIIDGATEDRPNADIFAKRLHENGVKIIPNQSKTGHISGISFEINGEKMKGSDLGRSYSWKNLTKRKLNYGRNTIQNRAGDDLQSHERDKSRNKSGYNSNSIAKIYRQRFRGPISEDQKRLNALSRAGQQINRFGIDETGPNEGSNEIGNSEFRCKHRQHDKQIKKRKPRSSKAQRSLQTVKGKSRSEQLYPPNQQQQSEYHIQRNNSGNSSWIDHLFDAEFDLLSGLFEIKEQKEKSKNRLKIKMKPKKVIEKTVDQSLSKSNSLDIKKSRSKGFDIDF